MSATKNRDLGAATYSRLKEMILLSQLKPGQKLLDRDLARELGVSRTPVREALIRLEHDGLVASPNGRGHVVTDVSASQIADLYDLREVLEVRAIRLAIERMKDADLDDLSRLVDVLDTYRNSPAKRGEEIRKGLLVHKIIARASGDAFLQEFLNRLLDCMQFFIWMDTVSEDPDSAEETRREHRAFLDLIREKRVDEAEALVRKHIRTAKGHILRIVEAREAFYTQTGPR